MKEKIKKIALIVLRIFLCIVRVSYCIIPFLYKLIPLVYAYIIWGVLAVIFIVAEIILWIVNRNKALDKTTNILYRGSPFLILLTFACAFVVNYFDTDFTWLWAIALIAFFAAPILAFNFFNYVQKSKYGVDVKETRKNRMIVSYSMFGWLLDAFYISIFNKCLFLQIALGTVILAILLYSVSTAFLATKEKQKWLIIFDFIFVIGLSIYLVYIIPNSGLQNIVLVLMGSIYGGFLTLVGVAWTIQETRKQEQEKKRIENMPYFRAKFSTLMLKNGNPFSAIPKLILTVFKTKSEVNNCLSQTLSITNDGLGMAVNIKCYWITETDQKECDLPASTMKNNTYYDLDIWFYANSNQKTKTEQCTFRFEFDDLLGNHYSQLLQIRFCISTDQLVISSYEMMPPEHIE